MATKKKKLPQPNKPKVVKGNVLKTGAENLPAGLRKKKRAKKVFVNSKWEAI
jgi:hypothetical protein